MSDYVHKSLPLVNLKDNLMVNTNLHGSRIGNFFGILFGTAQVVTGIVITVGSGSLGTVIGGSLVASGIGGATYSFKTDAKSLNPKGYIYNSLKSATSGVIVSTVGLLGIGAGFVVKVGYGALCGVAGGVTRKLTETVVEKKDFKISFSELASSAASGVVGTVIGSGTDVLRNKIVHMPLKVCTVATGGAIQGATTTVVSNAITGKPLGNNIGEKALIHAFVGTTQQIVTSTIKPEDSTQLNNGVEKISKEERPLQTQCINPNSLQKQFSRDIATGSDTRSLLIQRAAIKSSVMSSIKVPKSNDLITMSYNKKSESLGNSNNEGRAVPIQSLRPEFITSPQKNVSSPLREIIPVVKTKRKQPRASRCPNFFGR